MDATDITPVQRKTILALLKRHLPGVLVWAFGSRVKWTSRPESDLDLVAFASPSQKSQVSALREAFEESDLPFRVDLLVWDELPPTFQKNIRKEHVVFVDKPEEKGVPEGWNERFLGDIAEIVMGQSPTGETYNSTGVGLPLLNGPTEYGPYHPIPVQFTKDPKKKAVVGDILFCVRGSTTGCMNWADQDYAIGRGIAAIRHKAGKEYQPFLRGLIEYQLPELLAHATGSTFPNVSYDQISKLSCEIPPLPTQHVIARILGALGDLIELNRRTNETLEQIARTLFNHYFPYSPDDELPKEWRVGTIGEIAENQRIGVAPDEITADTAYIGLEHMPRRSIALAEWGMSAEVVSGKFRFEKGDILFGKLRPYFHKVGITPMDGVCSTDILVIRAKKHEWHSFVLAHVSSDAFVRHADGSSTGTKMPRTNWRDMARYPITMPPETLAAEYNRQVQPMLETIVTNIHGSRTLSALRDLLLPKLLSGEIRVKGN